MKEIYRSRKKPKILLFNIIISKFSGCQLEHFSRKVNMYFAFINPITTDVWFTQNRCVVGFATSHKVFKS